MTVCPIAIVAGCKKCPAVGFCPLKTVLGDYEKPAETGLFAEAGSFYWWNARGSDNTLGYWYADRHIEGFGNILFMDTHVASVETPYPNGTAFGSDPNYDVSDPD